MRKKIISARKFIKPSFSYLVEKKRDGGEFSEDEYNMCKSVAEKLDFTERELQLIIKLSFKGEILF